MSGKKTRTLLNPFLALTFLISAATGIMLVFHAGSGAVKHLHEWMSVLLLILCVIHLVINWKSLLKCLKRLPVIVSLIVVTLFSIVLLLTGNRHGTPPHGNSDGVSNGAIFQSGQQAKRSGHGNR